MLTRNWDSISGSSFSVPRDIRPVKSAISGFLERPYCPTVVQRGRDHVGVRRSPSGRSVSDGDHGGKNGGDGARESERHLVLHETLRRLNGAPFNPQPANSTAR